MGSMPPAFDEWLIVQGGTLEDSYVYYDDDGEVVDVSSLGSGTYIKLCKTDFSSTYLTLTTTPTAGGSKLTLGSNGTITFYISATDSAALAFTETGADGRLEAVIEGQITISGTNVDKFLRGRAILLKQAV
jgi:hypothetical protein